MLVRCVALAFLVISCGSGSALDNTPPLDAWPVFDSQDDAVGEEQRSRHDIADASDTQDSSKQDSEPSDSLELPFVSDQEELPDAADDGELPEPADVKPDIPPPTYTAPDGIEFVFFDIGQGDAILARFPGGSTMLVDGGPNGAGKKVIVPELKKLNMTKLDVVVVTHPDMDHCGGLDDVVNAIPVGEVWENGLVADTGAWWDFSDAVDKKKIPREVVYRGYSRKIDGCDVDVLNADEGWWDSNGNSVVLTVRCEGVLTLLTGDAHAGTQEDLVDEFGHDLKSDIVKIPHHGSADRYVDFPKYIVPEGAACMVGATNPYGHPNADVIAEWEAVGAKFYRTDQMGTIRALAKEGKIQWDTEMQ